MPASNAAAMIHEINSQRKTIQEKNTEIKKLKQALRSFIDVDQSESDSYDSHAEGDYDEDDEDEEHEAMWSDHVIGVGRRQSKGGKSRRQTAEVASPEVGLPEPAWDGYTYWCTSCACEVIEGECHCCGMEHLWDEDEDGYSSFSVDNQAMDSERSLVPRGNTPTRDTEDKSATVLAPPSEYQGPRRREYEELLKRGATRLMCDTFHLEYTHKHGIFAWADSDLYDEFAGPMMQKGDFWKIHLGRQVSLDVDDFDGADFITGLIEDALYFGPFEPNAGPQWVTVEESPGIWVTKMLEGGDCGNSEDEEEGHDDANGEDKDENDDDDQIDADLEDADPIRKNEYSFSDDDSDDEARVMIEDDTGSTWHSAFPDGRWEPDDDDDVDVIMVPSGDGEEEVAVEVESSCDSDFDEDETMSGDEF